LRDLDRDADCAGEFLKQKGLAPSEWMSFRLAVREVESWLLADASGLSNYLHVPLGRFPSNPDAEADPTVTLVNLARHSVRSWIRKAFVPPSGGHAQVGPLYEASIIAFASSHWSLNRACRRSDSLRRARAAMRELADRWRRRTGGT
jgi:hypothetical protein